MERSPLFEEYLRLIDPVAGKDMTLEEHQPMGPEDALLVIDMQNDFVPFDAKFNPTGGAFGVAEGFKCIRPIVNLINQAAEVGAEVVATRDYHPFDHVSFNTDGGPFPPHCVQGSDGSRLLTQIAEALAKAKAKQPDKVHVAFKAFHEDVDSFGGLPYQSGVVYPKGGQERVSCRSPGNQDQCPIGHGCTQTPWTGCVLLKQSQLEKSVRGLAGGGVVTDEDINCPPDVLAFEEAGKERRNRRSLHEYLKKCKRLFVCGLALDFCVKDTCVNARALGLGEVFLILDASRAAHIGGVGSFGTGFLSPPHEFLPDMKKAGVQVTYAVHALGPAGVVAPTTGMVDVKTYADERFPAELPPLGLADLPARKGVGSMVNLQGANQYKVTMTGDLQSLVDLGWGNTGNCSPKTAIPAGWPGAPPEATQICWAYPISDTKHSANSMLAFLKLSQSKELSFAVRGGFLLLADSGTVVKTQLVVAGGNIVCGPGQAFPKEQVAPMNARFQGVTLPFLRKRGATHFCWICPSEKIGTFCGEGQGGFAYRLQDESKGPVYFPVTALNP